MDKLTELALSDKTALHKPAAKVGPWDTKKDFSHFTKHGTALKDYEVLALEVGIFLFCEYVPKPLVFLVMKLCCCTELTAVCRSVIL
jgi:hypothetical protein